MKAKIISAAMAVVTVWSLGGSIRIQLGQDYNRYLTSSANGKIYSSSEGLKEPFDLNRDFYVELVMRLDKSDPASALPICGFGGMEMRYLRGPFQLLYTHTATTYCFNNTITEPRLRYPLGDLHHVILMSVGRVCRLYVDGELFATQDWSQNYSQHPWEELKNRNSKSLSFAPSHEIRLFRVGYLADGENEGEDPSTLVASHYNNGDPLRYELSAPTRLVDMRQKDFRLKSALNPVSGQRLYPAAALDGTVSWRTDDPYRRILTGEGVPALAPRYAGQYYRDTVSGRLYLASGNGAPGDWRGFVYASDIGDILVQSVGGVSLFGGGNIVIGSAEPYREVVDVTATGAVGDGIADDTAAIAEALRIAKTGGKALYFPVTAPGGSYRVTSPIELDGTIGVSGANGARIVSDRTVFAVTGSDIRISDLAVVSSGSTAVAVSGARRVRFERVAVESAGVAFGIENASDVWIESASVASALAGVKLTGSRRVSVSNGAFEGCACGVSFEGGNSSSLVTANVFVDCAIGAAASSGDADLVFARNVFDNSSDKGVRLDGAKRVNVKANIFRAFPAAVTPIACLSSYSAISGNSIARSTPDATLADIVLTGSDAVTVGGNVMDGRIVTDGATRIAESANLKAE